MIAPKFRSLLEPCSFKGARGGRGSGKSNFVAEQLIDDCLTGHHRVACLREFQSSIRGSNKKLIEDKIRAFDLGHRFRSTDQEIRGPNDSLFVFKGLDGKSADSIKSMVGFTRGWVEEAQRISQRSLELLMPTFRTEAWLGDGIEPEIYFTWNPIGPDDPIEGFFANVDADDPDFECVTVQYFDNPWFPTNLQRQMERDRVRNPSRYAHIWLGEYQKRSEAAVFTNWRIEVVPTPPPRTRFYHGADWGFSIDPSCLVRCWFDEARRILYVDREAYGVGVEIDDLPALFDRVETARRWPIRADSARPETISYLKRRNFNIVPARKGPGSVEEGIEFLQSYDIVVDPRCRHTSDELSRYSYRIDRRTELVLPILEDDNNHVIDALRYAAEDARRGALPPLGEAAGTMRRAGSAPVRAAVPTPDAAAVPTPWSDALAGVRAGGGAGSYGGLLAQLRSGAARRY